MNAWHSLAITVLVQVTVITSGAAIAMGFARGRAALRHAIGVLALMFVLASPALALLLPRAPWLGGVAQNDAGPEPAAVVRPAAQPAHAAAKVIAPRDQLLEVTAESVVTRPRSKPLNPNELHEAAGPSKPPGGWAAFAGADRTVWLIRGFTLAFWVWPAGIAIFCLRFLSVRRQLRSLATSVQRGSIDVAAAEEARRALGLKQLPPVGISDLAPMPLVLGCWRPVVVLPRRLVETGSAARLRDVLIHEFAHILRRDPWINVAQHVARVVFWPHPGVHWLNRQIARSREEVCDNFVLHSANSANYAQTLLELAEHCGGAHFALSLLGMFSRRWSLEKRIAGILKPGRIKTTHASPKSLAVVTLLLAATCRFVGGVGALARDAKEPSAEPAPQAARAIGSDGEKPAREMKKITLHGTCHDQDSKPVPRLWVRVFRCAYDSDPPKLLGEARSNDDGRFSISNVEISADAVGTKGKAYLQFVVTSKGYASAVKLIDEAVAIDELSVEMSNDPGTLSGTVTNAQGRPVEGVTVFLPCCGSECVPDFMSAVTDEQGRYSINDLKCWKPEDTKTVDPKTGTIQITPSGSLLLRHPDYALTRAMYSSIPQVLNVALSPPAIIEGHVVDQVTGKPLAKVVVSAQGVARGDWHQTRTDQAGFYRMLTNKDHFNIWAEADDRIAIAVKAVAVEPGTTVKDADVHMVHGGFVMGTVIDGTTGMPVVQAADKIIRVAHYGPARPRTGAAVTFTPVSPDGTYRLRVAPGKNYVYLMSGGTSGIVEVSEGQETKLDLRSGEYHTDPIVLDDPDIMLAEKLRREAREEDEEKTRKTSGAADPPKAAKRQRPDTPVGRLLGKLEEQNAGSARFHDSWLRTLKAIVEVGPEAVPELIAELDATSDNMMLRCCGFTLRAIGDKRAVPALIRSIPTTLLPPGSDMGLRSEDAELAKWAQQHDLDGLISGGNQYSFGRPVREIFGALNKLTGEKMGEHELYHMSLDGVESQRQMKRELFYREAKQWADWWDQHATEYTQDVAYAHVNLPQPAAETAKAPPVGAHYKTGGGSSGWVLQSILDPKAGQSFYDLDTGRVASLPEKWREATNIELLRDEIFAWAAHEGFDLMGTEYATPDGQRYYALRAIGLRAWELDSKRWKMTSNDITVESLQAEGTPTDGLLLHFDQQTQSIDPRGTASFLYITRKGTPGLLFVGIEVKDDSLKPGGRMQGDNELNPVAFHKGRRFGFTEFEEAK